MNQKYPVSLLSIFKLLTAVYFLGVANNDSSAYSLDTHKIISEKTFEAIKGCRVFFETVEFSKRQQEQFIDGNLGEDRNFALKARNWHFYRPDRDLGPGSMGLGYGSLNNRFQNVEDELHKKMRVKDLGRLAHYVQDVTNPAHVTPVYHSAFDSFDNFDFKELMLTTFSEADCREIERLTRSYNGYFKLLDVIAMQTRLKLKDEFKYSEKMSFFDLTLKKGKTISWGEAFWDESFGEGSLRRNWGRYGIFGNEFGKAENQNRQIPMDVFKKFAQGSVRSAQIATAAFMHLYFKQQ